MPVDLLQGVLIAAAAMLAAGLTFFAGFGLGSMLLPVFAIFFPAELAVLATAIVHFVNNVTKATLMGRYVNWRVALWFGGPAVLAAVGGALLLDRLTELPVLYEQGWGPVVIQIKPLEGTIALMMIGFAIVELFRSNARVRTLPRMLLPLGGVLSGFFGGLSGHQGAFRSAVLIRAGLDKNTFIGTGVAIALAVDLVRITTYSISLEALLKQAYMPTIFLGCLAAIFGSLSGRFLLQKVTLQFVQQLVALGILLIALALGLGLI
jgi:hypothetical protein